MLVCTHICGGGVESWESAHNLEMYLAQLPKQEVGPLSYARPRMWRKALFNSFLLEENSF